MCWRLCAISRVKPQILKSGGKFVITFKNGIMFVPEDRSSNTSGIAKYLTKEISLDNPGTSIDVKLTANVRDIKNIKVLYKYKRIFQ